jgi:hypothetical protein
MRDSLRATLRRVRGTIERMAGKDDDIERLLAEMDALTQQADKVLSGDAAAAGKAVAPRAGSTPATTGSGDTAGASGAITRALVVSGVVTAVVWVAFFLLAALPFIGRPGLGDALALFVASLLVAAFYSLRNRG